MGGKHLRPDDEFVADTILMLLGILWVVLGIVLFWR